MDTSDTVHITTDRAAEEATLNIARGIASEHLNRRADLCGIFMGALTSVPPTVFHRDRASDNVLTRKSGHITLDWKRIFATVSMSSLNLVSDDAMALVDTVLTLCALHGAAPDYEVGNDEAAVLCAIWSYRNVYGTIDADAAHKVAVENFALRGMGPLEEDRFVGILIVLNRLRIIGFSNGVITMPETVALTYP